MSCRGLPHPRVCHRVIYFFCSGMFAAGVGMLYTPILVDRMQLTFPSGLAVANILRALTDPVLLRQSVNKLGSGIGIGIASGVAATKVAWLEAIEFSASTFGAGMVVGARIGIPAIVAGLLGWALIPYFVSIGWLKEGDPFRKITFLIALGMIMGAAALDLALIFWEAQKRWREKSAAPKAEPADWKRVNTQKLVFWIIAWGIGIVASGHFVLGHPVGYLTLAVALVFVFAMVNGISLGISDSNPISSAFVVTVLIMATLGLKDPVVGLMAGAIMLISTNTAADMQQDRSTGWRIGTNRVMQFRYQVAGILMGAIMGVVFAKLFMTAYPVLLLDQTTMKAGEQPANWSAAMTYKFVGILRSLTDPKPYQITAIWVGVGLGFATQVARKLILQNAAWRKFAAASRAGFATDFVVDAVLLPSPYAYPFGGFVNLNTSLWFGAGGIASSAWNTVFKPKPSKDGKALPEEMSSTSLFGGGLIAGDALAALGIGIVGLVGTLASR